MSIINCSNRSSEGNAGLYFKNCNGVTLYNLIITNCSILQNFTASKYRFRCGMIIENSSNIIINHVTVTRNEGYGVVLMNNYHGTFNISFSNFTQNSLSTENSENIHGGAGIMIFVSLCDIDVPYCSLDYSFTPETLTQYNFMSVNFANNNHTRPKRLWKWTLCHGGGLNIILNWGAIGQYIQISDTTFTGNTAVGGAGMGVLLHEMSSNSIIVTNSSFLMNNVPVNSTEGGGGGIKIICHNNTQRGLNNNEISFKRCNFTGNTAAYGGGTSLVISGADEIANKSSLTFVNCQWISNRAIVGSAVDIHVSQEVQQYLVKTLIAVPTFENCWFHSNLRLKKFRQNGTEYQGLGSFLTSKVKVNFKGNITFSDNEITALYLISATVRVSEGSVMEFHNNRGENKGGAIAFTGFSIMKYENNTIFNFTFNRAKKGGAIYAENIDPHSSFASRICFLQSANGKAKNVSFLFTDNTPEAIFTTTLHPCRYVCQHDDSRTPPLHPFTEDNTCLGEFIFSSNNSFNVTTEAFKIVVTKEVLEAIPGRSVLVPVEFKDDLNNTVTSSTIYYPQLEDQIQEHIAIIDSSTQIVSDNRIILHGYPGSNGTLQIKTQGNRHAMAEIKFKLSPCPPGYVYDHSSKSCHCSETMPKVYQYHGIKACNDSSLDLFIIPGLWLGYINITGSEEVSEDELFTSICPRGYCNVMGHGKGNFYQVKSNASIAGLENVVCSENRKGIFCSQCAKGTSVFYHSDTYRCHTNSHYCNIGLLFYIISDLIPITLLFVFVLYFNFNFTNGAAYSIVFMIQQIHILEINDRDSISIKYKGLLNVAEILYSMLNLNFLNLDHLSFCLWKSATTLDVMVMGYISVSYAIVLILLMVYFKNRCFTRCCRRYSGSVVQGLTAFLVVCFSHVTHVTFNLLNKEIPIGKGGKPFSKTLVFLDGELEIYKGKHLYYAIPALLFLCLIVLPTPLILLCDPLLLKLESRVLQRKPIWTRFRERFKPLLDSFQGCFKDKLRFFAGMFFLYRIVILCNLILSNENSEYYFFNQTLFLIMLVVQAIVQPFHKKSHNIIACLCFSNLLAINTLSIRISSLVANNGYSLETIIMQQLQIFLVSLPMLIGLGWLGKKLLEYLRMKSPRLNRFLSRRTTKVSDDISISLIYDRKEYKSLGDKN